MSFAGFMLRTLSKRSDDKRDAGLTTPEGIERFDDLCYGEDAKWNLLDLYRPRGRKEKLPVIVSVHGGGWVYGDKERYQYYCMSLAEQGFAVVNYTYRLAPKFKFPAPLEDTNAVFHWMMRNAEPYGLDTTRVFGVGDSAGAQLLALYSCICTNPAYAASYAFSAPEHFAPTAIALNCGIYEIQFGNKKDLVANLMADYLPEKGSERERALNSVLRNVTKDFPPSFIMTCEGDMVIEQAPPLVERLQTLSVPVEYHYYGDKEHVLGHVFHCNIRSADAQQCNTDECNFFKRYL